MTAVRLGRAVMGRIRLNLFWAFAYNVILIPLAAGLLYPYGIIFRPEYGALVMALSSFTVISLSLMLRRFDSASPRQLVSPVLKSNIARDPVCGMDVEVDSARWMSEYKGEKYYFCNPGCKEMFDSQPDSFLT